MTKDKRDLLCAKALVVLKKKYGRVSVTELSFLISSIEKQWFPPSWFAPSIHRLKQNSPNFRRVFGYLPPFATEKGFDAGTSYFVGDAPNIKYGQAVKLTYAATRIRGNVSRKFYEANDGNRWLGTFEEIYFNKLNRRDHSEFLPKLFLDAGELSAAEMLAESPDDYEDYEDEIIRQAAAIKQMQNYALKRPGGKFFAKRPQGAGPEEMAKMTEAEILAYCETLEKDFFADL